jgi:hypothetical protein
VLVDRAGASGHILSVFLLPTPGPRALAHLRLGPSFLAGPLASVVGPSLVWFFCFMTPYIPFLDKWITDGEARRHGSWKPPKWIY